MTVQSLRAFGLAHTAAGTVAHDPCTGLTHHDPRGPADRAEAARMGRVWLDGRAVTAWPVIHPRELARPLPVSVCWSPLVRCNLRCPHCLDDKVVPEAGRARRAEVAAHLAAARALGLLGVDISGGEPLLLADLPELADRLAGGGLVVSVTTNGWHLARRATELAGHLDAVRVSLDGPDQARHDRWRGAGSFQRALAGLCACRALGIPTQLQTVLMASTRHAAQQMVDLAAAHGVHGLTFLQMLPIGEGARLAAAELLSDAQARAALDRLTVPPGLMVRLRERDAADGFTVVRADATVWRNRDGAHRIIRRSQPLTRPDDLAVGAVADGSA